MKIIRHIKATIALLLEATYVIMMALFVTSLILITIEIIYLPGFFKKREPSV